MRSETVTTVLSAPPETVFNYISDIENLPEWATEFARELKREGEDYKVLNGLGEFYFEIQADRVTGVIDMFAGPSEVPVGPPCGQHRPACGLEPRPDRGSDPARPAGD